MFPVDCAVGPWVLRVLQDEEATRRRLEEEFRARQQQLRRAADEAAAAEAARYTLQRLFDAANDTLWGSVHLISAFKCSPLCRHRRILVLLVVTVTQAAFLCM